MRDNLNKKKSMIMICLHFFVTVLVSVVYWRVMMSSPLRRSTSGHSILHNVHISLKYINLRFSNLETSYGILHWDTPEVILYPVIFISISGDKTQKLISSLLVPSIFRQGFKMIRINGTKSGRMGHILDETRLDQMD